MASKPASNWLTRTKAAYELGIPLHTLDYWARKKPSIGPPRRIDPTGRKSYRRDEIDTYLAQRNSTGAAPSLPAIPAVASPFATPLSVASSPEDAWQAIQTWRHNTIQRVYLRVWRLSPTRKNAFASRAVKIGDLIYALGQYQGWRQLPNFDTKLCLALGITPNHPVTRQPLLRQWFQKAWLDVERHIENFRRADFSRWPEADEDG